MPFSLTLGCSKYELRYWNQCNMKRFGEILAKQHLIINQIPKTIFRNMFFFKYEIYQVPWNSMEFHGTSKKVPWNSMELFGGKLKVPWNSMELGSMEKIPWNSMELLIWKKFHGIPWNHRCCSNVVQRVPWNSGESSMELFDQINFNEHWKRFWMIFCYVMNNAGNAYKV